LEARIKVLTIDKEFLIYGIDKLEAWIYVLERRLLLDEIEMIFLSYHDIKFIGLKKSLIAIHRRCSETTFILLCRFQRWNISSLVFYL